MASSYPGSLDSLQTTHADGVGEVIDALDINNLADAVNKIEAELGTVPSAAWSTVRGRLDGLVINVRDQGAKGDGKTVTDGAMTSASAVLTSATAAFTSADVGKTIQVARASSTMVDLYTTITVVTNATTVTIGMPAGSTGTGRTLTIDGLRTVADAATTTNSTTVTSATAAFTAADVGKQVKIVGVHSVALNTTILSYQSATQVTLNANATRTVTAAQVVWGTNDTAALIASLELARDATTTAPATVYIPNGLYLSAPSQSGTGGMLVYDNTKVIGDGWSSVLRHIGGVDSSGELLGVNTWDRGDTNPENNVKNVTICDLHLQGTVVEDGFYQYQHLLAYSATSDITVDRVKFSNFRGDAIYAGSSTSSANLERHNQRAAFRTCLFDGINRDNRNAISIIDGDHVLIESCAFRNTARDDMPGAIDFEPNPSNFWPVIRSFKVLNCHFYFNGGNIGTINAFLWESQNELTNPFEGFEIAGCTFRNSVGSMDQIGFYQEQYATDTTARMDLDIHHNLFFDGLNGIQLSGVRGAKIKDNWFIRSGGQAGVILGYRAKTLDVDIKDNTFFQTGGSFGYGVLIHNGDRTVIDSNTFENTGLADLTKGIPLEMEAGGGLLQPSGITATPFTTGGTLGAATRSYRLTTFKDGGNETLATTAVTAVTTGATARVDLSWTPDARGAGTKIYGRAGGSELLMATLGPNVWTWTDTGAITPSGALPGSNTTANGNSTDIRFSNNNIRQGGSNRITAIVRQVAGHTTAIDQLTYANNTTPAGSLSIGPFKDLGAGFKRAARVVSLTNLTIPPGGTTLTVDGIALANGDRVLLAGQTSSPQNGVYIVGGIGTSVTLTRAGDANTQAQVGDGMIVGVEDGTGQANSVWQLITTNPITIGTTNQRFTRLYPPYANPFSSVTTAQGPFMPTSAILENFTRWGVTTANQGSLSTGTVRVFPMGILRANHTASAINFMVATTASAALTNSWGGICRASDRVVLAISATSTATTAANTLKTFTFASAFTANIDEAVLGFLMYQGTPPSFMGIAAGASQLMALAPVVCGTSNTGATSPVAVGATLTAFTGSQACPWAYLS